tara:strand:+ start:7252 stop:7944 length:693 start_codon:yes stop_codon:yes gene_type:complete
VDCYRDDYVGPKPNWVNDLTLANYDDFQAIWSQVDLDDLLELVLYEVGERCELGEGFFEEKPLDRYMTQKLEQQSLGDYPFQGTAEEKKLYSQSRITARREILNSTECAKFWWDVLRPMTGPNLKSGQLVLQVSSYGREDETEWVECTLYEQVEVDDYAEYPGEKLCPVTFEGLILVGTAVAQSPYTVPMAYYVVDVDIDEETVLDVTRTTYEREFDKDDYYSRKYGVEY